MPGVRILEAAAAEAAGAAAWYESQRTGLGSDFREDFKAALDNLQEGVALPGLAVWASGG
jgi:toxin ParE1/3/4